MGEDFQVRHGAQGSLAQEIILKELTSTRALNLIQDWLPKQRWFPVPSDQQVAIEAIELRYPSDLAQQSFAPTESTHHELALAIVKLTDQRKFLLPLLLNANLAIASEAAESMGLIGKLPLSASQRALAAGEERFLSDATASASGRLQLAKYLLTLADLEAPTSNQVRADFTQITNSQRISAEQSNTSLIFESASSNHYILKLFRNLQDGINPDVQIHQALQKLANPHIAPFYGTFKLSGAETTYLGQLNQFYPQVKDAWQRALTAAKAGDSFRAPAYELGFNLAKIHQDLKKALEFAPASFDLIENARQIMISRLAKALELAPQIKSLAGEITKVYQNIQNAKWPDFQRIHGDLHLGQILHHSNKWVFLDFEGEPLRPLSQRLELDSPLRDLAGLLRSFDYASGFVSLNFATDAKTWALEATSAAITGYLDGQDQEIDPQVLKAYELDKAVYELVYELSNRPAWAAIPRLAIERLTS